MRINQFIFAFFVAVLAAPVFAGDKPVKVYLMVGQSNMQGKGGIEGDNSSSLRYTVENAPDEQYKSFVDAEGNWVERKDVWIHYDLAPFTGVRYGGLAPGYGTHAGQVGPEFGFGHAMGDATDEKILIIKTAWGGKSLANDFLPPSIGQYETPVKPGDPGFFYHQMLKTIDVVMRDIRTLFPEYNGEGVEFAGFCWHQGWNDQYGGADAFYERNMAAFINDIRSEEHGLGVPDLPFVIATSGMIEKDSLVKDGQKAMADASKYPQFVGNVAVVDTDKPYGPEQMAFKFYTKGSPDKVSYHWNNHARSYVNIGIAMAAEMRKLTPPATPARFAAYGSAKGVDLTWQIGTSKPKSVEIKRNGKALNMKIDPMQTAVVDTTALPGTNSYEIAVELPSGKKTFAVTVDTSVESVDSYRGDGGVVLDWIARGKYDGFRIKRDGMVIANNLPADMRGYKDKTAPSKGVFTYTIEPTTGNATPAKQTVNIGQADAGGAVIYEPFDYPAVEGELRTIIGQGGAAGTKGVYVYTSDQKPERQPTTVPKSISFGELPVTGNRAASLVHAAAAYIELDDSLKKAGLLEDGATMWISYVIYSEQTQFVRKGGGSIALLSEDLTTGVGFSTGDRQHDTVVYIDAERRNTRIAGTPTSRARLILARITWGKGGEPDRFVPYVMSEDLKLPEKEGRAARPDFDIDQSKISRLVLWGNGHYDEIRVGPTFESVIGAGMEKKTE